MNLESEQVRSELDSLAQEYLSHVQNELTDHEGVISISDITDYTTDYGDVKWEFIVETNPRFVSNANSDRFVVSVKAVHSEEYEGEDFGFAISVDVVWSDGHQSVKYSPKNFTEDVWTFDVTELQHRLQNMPQITIEDIQ